MELSGKVMINNNSFYRSLFKVCSKIKSKRNEENLMNNKRTAWIVLITYTILACVNQLHWLNFAPILSVIQEKYGVSELLASSLILIFPLLYVVLAIPAGILIDRKGYKSVVSIGAIIMSAFALLRIFDESFWVLLAGQVGIAISQPFIMNAISKIVGDWFDKEQHAITTGIVTIGMFVGMASGLAVTPMLITGSDIQFAMVIYAAITVLASVLFIAFVKEQGRATDETTGSISEIKELIGNKNITTIIFLSFLALGTFNGLTTWLEPILGQQGISIQDAGLVGGLLIIGGIVGSAIIPAISDKVRKRKPFLPIAAASGALLIYPLTTGSDLNSLLLFGGLFGALLLPGYAILLTMAEEEVGPKKAGAATGLLMLTGNAGGVIVPLAMEVIKNDVEGWINAIYFLVILLVIAVVFSFLTKETYHSNGVLK